MQSGLQYFSHDGCIASRIIATQAIITGTRKPDAFCVDGSDAPTGVMHVVVAGQRQLVESTVTMHHPGALRACGKRSSHGVHSTNIGDPHQHVRHGCRVGHWPQQVEDGRNSEFTSNRPHMTKRGMECRRKGKPESDFGDAAGHPLRRLFDSSAESFQHVCGATFAGGRSIAVLAHGNSDTRNDECSHGGYVDRAALVSPGADDVDGLLGDFRWQGNRRGSVAYGAQETTEFILRCFTSVVLEEKPTNLVGRQPSLQDLVHSRLRSFVRERISTERNARHRTKATSVTSGSPQRCYECPTEWTAVSGIVVSELEYGPPGGDQLFFDVSFRVAPGEHAAIVGANGVGKSTILRILTGQIEADAGEFSINGTMLYMTQDVGMSRPTDTLREMLIEVAPPALREAGRELVRAEHAMHTGADDGMAYATALSHWGDLGGYELESQWQASAQRSVKSQVDDVFTRLVSELSGGERKRLVLDLLLHSGADVLLLDEPDNYLDIPTRQWLEDELRTCPSTILMVSHDRTLLERCSNKIIAVEGSGCWVHGGSFATFPEAREKRQELLGDDLKRWHEEERRLFHHMKIMKQRAAQNFKNATKANAAETRWEKFVAAGPPPPPVPDQQIYVRLRGADAARRVAQLNGVSMHDLFRPFSDEIYHGERVALIGPNGTGKTHLLKALSQELTPTAGEVRFGPRTSVGVFTQINNRPDFLGRECIDIVHDRISDEERAMKTLARYGLRNQARQKFETLSGGQKARLEILRLEIEGHNVLLLDEPTDNLDIESSEALEKALDGFEGTVVAVSHDRTFLAQFDRYIMITDSGEVYALPDFDVALRGLQKPDQLATLKLAKPLHE
ncbi:MAG: hypothetical protein RIR87_68 [Actinomycetota bacterium]